METKPTILFLIAILFALCADAQNFVKSYSAYRAYNPSTGYQMAANQAMPIYFYDGYIKTSTGGKFVYGGSNLDGSRKYYPTQVGAPILSTQMIIISKDYSQMREIQQSSFGGMTMQIIYDYQYIGDGEEPAQRMMRGYGREYEDSNSDYTCKSCGGSGDCEYCGGTGKPSYSGETVCGICHGTGRCQGCKGKGKY